MTYSFNNISNIGVQVNGPVRISTLFQYSSKVKNHKSAPGSTTTCITSCVTCPVFIFNHTMQKLQYLLKPLLDCFRCFCALSGVIFLTNNCRHCVFQFFLVTVLKKISAHRQLRLFHKMWPPSKSSLPWSYSVCKWYIYHPACVQLGYRLCFCEDWLCPPSMQWGKPGCGTSNFFLCVQMNTHSRGVSVLTHTNNKSHPCSTLCNWHQGQVPRQPYSKHAAGRIPLPIKGTTYK